MVARGDLGMEVPVEKVVILQKYIANKTINAGKFCITATQMLESMEQKPRPTRAEISDVTNSVYDLADSNMTSGETSIGLFPIETAAVLKSVILNLFRLLKKLRPQSIIRKSLRIENTRSILGTTEMSLEPLHLLLSWTASSSSW